MSEGTQGVLILIAIAAVIGLIAHARVHRFWPATIAAGLLSSVIFQAVAFVRDGRLDPFFLVALIFGTIYTIGIAALVGVPFYISRRKKPA